MSFEVETNNCFGHLPVLFPAPRGGTVDITLVFIQELAPCTAGPGTHTCSFPLEVEENRFVRAYLFLYSGLRIIY